MPRANTETARKFEQPGLQPADGLRPDVQLRLDLLSIIYRPDRDAAWHIDMASRLEPWVISGGVPKGHP